MPLGDKAPSPSSSRCGGLKVSFAPEEIGSRRALPRYSDGNFFKDQPLKDSSLPAQSPGRRVHPHHQESHQAAADDSRILIMEDVLDTPPSTMAAIVDFMMMGLGGKQCTLAMWEKMLATVGPKINSISRKGAMEVAGCY
ncbi:hypothetical protein B0H63DRAFT_558313 [Podospora didyma]|uniref:Uncharacterized protein n=1 Tax=Podospora didyma TaxID=330526 RepID=A0AAE0U0P8_9PEZI|nr:hypothetical protein B0H63DRAFT_558313 [Podospora didyma]